MKIGREVKFLDIDSAFTLLCKATHKWGLYIRWEDDKKLSPEEYTNSVFKAAPYLLSHQKSVGQIFVDCEGIMLFDSESEMMRYYNYTVGDDGPTRYNHYNGPIHIYALTCNPNGQPLDVNT